ncbi:hypothetical protein QK292_02330 [Arthrobacter sp. AL08]|uniref:hypothetical protein n=1 Tax=Micrococcaceae TaxID=1268 RepID=UPI001CFFA142|nr:MULTISPECIES: hypothetical protein [Micrococcaceae]MCB5282605.1 hypothetical protein [Arthrobacter sp. ES1]MDI3240404.1 hypothetical protein [Arthrobacter sp. AL05]MDI3276414.1 hypothetical protein [Arthrobacter sp. AL08]MDJ0353743.1 hypothetical protein [Pseudarthrobacter sp. PH31-O2]WGZ79198.1 hypothetical protein QI450_15275 [Arthrobacter sp. EM1]
MTPANNPHHSPLTAVSSGGGLKTASPLSQAVHRGSSAHHPRGGQLNPHLPTLVEADYVGSPFCERCGNDEFIYLETFVPATHRRDGSINKLGEVTYFCSGCDDFSAHAVPASWVPPGWYFG